MNPKKEARNVALSDRLSCRVLAGGNLSGPFRNGKRTGKICALGWGIGIGLLAASAAEAMGIWARIAQMIAG